MQGRCPSLLWALLFASPRFEPPQGPAALEEASQVAEELLERGFPPTQKIRVTVSYLHVFC